MSNSTLPIVPLDTIPVDDAILGAANWRDFLAQYLPIDMILKGFYIPINDIKSLGEYHKVEGARGYICMMKPSDLSTIKMVIVPVDDNGQDKLWEKRHKDDDDDESCVYDLTKPCPAFCDESSLLNGFLPTPPPTK